MASEKRPTYLYYFNKENGGIGTWHAGEMPYLYGNLSRNLGSYDEADYALSENMQDYLVNYVKTGDPNGGDLPKWETYNKKPGEIMSFGEKVGMMEQKHNDFYKIVDAYMEGLR